MIRLYSVIRIYQEDVWADRHDWKENLLEVIKKYDEPINIFISTIYKSHSNYKSTYESETESKSEWNHKQNTLFDGYNDTGHQYLKKTNLNNN